MTNAIISKVSEKFLVIAGEQEVHATTNGVKGVTLEFKTVINGFSALEPMRTDQIEELGHALVSLSKTISKRKKAL